MFDFVTAEYNDELIFGMIKNRSGILHFNMPYADWNVKKNDKKVKGFEETELNIKQDPYDL